MDSAGFAVNDCRIHGYYVLLARTWIDACPSVRPPPKRVVVIQDDIGPDTRWPSLSFDPTKTHYPGAPDVRGVPGSV